MVFVSALIWMIKTGMTLSFLSEPLASGGDPTVLYAIAKKFIDGGWYTPNFNLGFPIGADWGLVDNYSEIIHLIQILILSKLSDNPITVINLFVILSAGVVSLSSFILFKLYSSTPIAFIFSLSITLLPYRVFRSPGHTLLTELSGLILNLITLTLIQRHQSPISRKILTLILASALYTSLTGQYYSVFSLFSSLALIGFLVLNGFIQNRFKVQMASIYFISIIAFLVLQKYVISFNNFSKPLGDISERNYSGSELYSGSFFSLILPSPYTGISYLRNIRDNFNLMTIFNGYEVNNYNSLIGVISVCVAIIFTILVISNSKVFFLSNSITKSIRFFVLLFILFVFFYIPTGLGSAFAFYVTDIIRGWGRLFPLIVIISMCIMLEILKIIKRNSKLIHLFIVTSLSIIFFFDQILGDYRYDLGPGNFTKNMAVTAAKDLSKNVPKGCGILQIPIVPFPEVPSLNRMQDYDHLWVYLFSKDYKFSYGAVKKSFAYQYQIDNFDLNQKQELVNLGFCHIILDTYSLRDNSEVKFFEAKYELKPVLRQNQNRWILYSLKN